MDNTLEDRIRDLAGPLWRSAAQPYGLALDFWLMAEQMVGEMLRTTAQIQKSMLADPPPLPSQWLPEAVPVKRIEELAKCMWEAAGRQYDATQDYWLAAERHVLTIMRAATVPQSASPLAKWAQELATLPPQAYLDQIRIAAYYAWEAAGRQYGRTLDHWLQAEATVLGSLAALARGVGESSEPVLPSAPTTTAPPAATASPETVMSYA
jgi:hypothetical protein